MNFLAENYTPLSEPMPFTSAKSILARIDARLAALGLNDNAAGVLAGSRHLIRSIRRNVAEGSQTGISSATLERLAPVLQTSSRWLLTGEGADEIAALKTTVSELSDDVSENIDAPAGINTAMPYRSKLGSGSPAVAATGGTPPRAAENDGGDGIVYEAQKVTGEVVLPARILQQLTDAPAERVHWLEAPGAAMEPTICAGDYVAFDTRQVEIVSGEIYGFLNDRGEIQVRRLQRIGDEVKVISDNTRIEPVFVKFADMTIFGRVVGRIAKVG